MSRMDAVLSWPVLVCAGPWLFTLSLLPWSPSARMGQDRSVPGLVAGLSAGDATVRAKAACDLKAEGDRAADAVTPLVQLLGDASPVDRSVCREQWRRGGAEDLTTPGEQAAAALVAIGSRAFQPLVGALQEATWIARRNAAWALGALDDRRAVSALLAAVRDREPGVREQAAWALGAIGDRAAVEPLVAALRDSSTGVREQAAWALGAIGDSRAVQGLIPVLKDSEPAVRRQAAWAIGAIGK